MYFETKRLALRNFEIKDLEELVDYRSNDLCSKFQRGQFKDNKNLTKLIEKSKNDDLFSIGKKRLAIIFKKTNEIVGDIFISIENQTISLGYTISYKYHRQGFAYELLSALIKELHKHYDKHEFVACVEKENIASKNLMLKLGFINEGHEEKISSLVFSKYGLK
ncbi:GNAT family N-acetyltransferase [Clostridium senegalense]|uniref:GNAT family N-acetyltransferase n=1 Tax=Clostridium senegalense TaxID=1465809 RepID=UPI001C0F74A6|nr:GNAT family N-acetyltransferase [Clostridium senegalense]MBU5225273.1 GNAT family N-acetyltransferase [Clostridium senegalense]